jgi:uncharacterized protein YecT (DUF1311 family)
MTMASGRMARWRHARMALAMLLTLGSAAARAQPAASGDPELDRCLGALGAKGSSATISKCLTEADTRWSERMNHAYLHLRGRLDPRSRDLLDQSQRAWMVFRGDELAFVQGAWPERQGSALGLNLAALRLSELRLRTLTLENYMPAQ